MTIKHFLILLFFLKNLIFAQFFEKVRIRTIMRDYVIEILMNFKSGFFLKPEFEPLFFSRKFKIFKIMVSFLCPRGAVNGWRDAIVSRERKNEKTYWQKNIFGPKKSCEKAARPSKEKNL